METKKRERHLVLLTLALASGFFIFYLLATRGLSLPCIFFSLTGLQCPGCGNTRAVLALFRGDLAAAFRFNPMFLPEVLYLGWVYVIAALSYRKGKGFTYRSPAKWLDFLLLIALILWWILRNL
ncbi:MAG: DUF2752 domain-containing protein [Clostridia bacterium]|nr:DUF2752 domain-containing protein [Clostridia bacterium]